MTIHFNEKYTKSMPVAPFNQPVVTRYKFEATNNLVQSAHIIYLLKLPIKAKLISFIPQHTASSSLAFIGYGLANGHPNGGGADYTCFGFRTRNDIRPVSPELLVGTDISVSLNDLLGYGILSAKTTDFFNSDTVTLYGTVIYTIEDTLN